MSEKLTTSRIEQMLFDKAKKEFVEELYQAISDFADVLNRYHPFNKEKAEEFKAWVLSFLCIGVPYIGGGIGVKINYMEQLPEYIQERLLNNAVRDFINSIEIKQFDNELKKVGEVVKNAR